MGDESEPVVGAGTAIDEKPSTGVTAFAKVLLVGFVPGSTLALVLLGYGYSQAVSAQFGVDAERIAGSISDYLQLSAYAVLFLLTRLFNLFGNWETFGRLYADLGWGLFVAALLILIGGWWAFHHPFSGGARVPKRLRDKRRSGVMRWLLPVGAAALGVVLSPAVMLAAVLSLMLVIGFAYFLIPFLGFTIGMTALHDLVVKPEHCVSLKTRQQRMAPPVKKESDNYVHCVALKKDGKEIARGRLVLATSQGVLLYHPNTGHVLHMPGTGVSVHPVEMLDQPVGAEQWL